MPYPDLVRLPDTPQDARPDEALVRAGEAFAGIRPRLLKIACRVLGDMTEAEDTVQEVWLRWQNTDPSQARDPVAFLVTTTVRTAINVAGSARFRREVPGDRPAAEPAAPGPGPAERAERAEAVDAALHLLLRKLNRVERAAFVLREAFHYEYGEIARILGTTPPNSRQIVSRARRRLRADHEARVSGAEHGLLLTAFLTAAQTGEVTALEHVLSGGTRDGGH
ncbi:MULTISPECIES: sigma-70 family RNA polymerase sigma factor [Streptomyces]|uniref:sigma-70 family RNA polymerase sigma factor n=1 Tax=Streptomyces TaxID=1883 RepID=UPI00240DC697|nr:MULTISPECIES: sigma-70 family RNA polymerase sigma factor [Streptomyces]WFB88488.1 sigma-70 family RNA polymerase sigma factor [Streptomyces olivaceus]WGK50931.1 sigma-70 family RNA polymerase sigma factor [Streptomyces sp. B146]